MRVEKEAPLKAKELTVNPVVHFEMPYENHQRLADFYSKTFGWQIHKLGSEMGDYVLAGTSEMDENMMIKTPGSINGGFFKNDGKQPPQPSVVISVENLKDAMKKVSDAGGTTLGEPQTIPGIGDFIAFKDSEGNQVGMLQPVKK